MLKLASILLSAILLIQGISINTAELQKIGELLEHAQFHKERYGDNFTSFLDKHYGNQKNQHNKEHQDEKNDHEQLPFHHSGPLVMQPVFLVGSAMPNVMNALLTESQQANYFYRQLHSSLLIREILHPPRYC